jgi:hypothetical protein
VALRVPPVVGVMQGSLVWSSSVHCPVLSRVADARSAALSRLVERLGDLDGLLRGHDRAGLGTGVEQQLDPAVDAPHQHRAGAAAVLVGTPGVDGVPVALTGMLAAHRAAHRVRDRQIRLGGLSCSVMSIISRCPQRAT